MIRLLVALVLFALLVGPLAGCDRNAKRLVTPQRMDNGLTIVLPGIEGKGRLNRNIRDGLADGGLPTAIRIHDWTLGPMMAVANQIMEARARRQAESLAEQIVRYKEGFPGRPVYLVGHSGGCGVALFTAESLPDEVSLDGIIMLAPSVAPDYDMTRALKHVNGPVYNYYSAKDRLLLGAGTWILGTMDGSHSSSAGKVGFDLPKPADPETMHQYRKLIQEPWRPAMSLSGNRGGHTDWADRRFVRDYIAPVLRRLMRTAGPPSGSVSQPADATPQTGQIGQPGRPGR